MRTMMFNPYTGRPRDPRDIASDPAGVLMPDPDEPLLSAQPPRPRPVRWIGVLGTGLAVRADLLDGPRTLAQFGRHPEQLDGLSWRDVLALVQVQPAKGVDWRVAREGLAVGMAVSWAGEKLGL